MRAARFLMATGAAVLAGAAARADVTISKKPTENMNCSGGMCTPTASKAVLNAGDLAGMLASSDVTVNTGGTVAKDIVVKDALSWTSTSRLTLDANRSVEIDKPVSVTGTGALTITTNDGGKNGDLTFAGKGHVAFWDLTSSLVINGNSYTLVNKLKDLRSVIANGTSFVALADTYDAQRDGTHSSALIGIVSSTQTIEGLGNQIQNLTISSTAHPPLALVNDNGGTIRDLGLTNVNINAPNSAAAGLAYSNEGTLQNCYATGTVQGGLIASGLVVGVSQPGIVRHSHASVTVIAHGPAGGLAAAINGTIETSYATGPVSGGPAGGLVGESNGTISQSFATGLVTGSTAGGLIGLQGFEGGSVSNSYATGGVNASSTGGGLIGTNQDRTVESSYSTGLVGGSGSLFGGLIGDAENEIYTNDYWDLDTSGIDDPHRGAGSVPDDPGITGLTTAQFQSGLPLGFDPKVWGQNPKTNGGYPYLRANPPNN